MKKNKSISSSVACATYTALWMLYTMQQSLGISVIGQYLLIALLSFSCYKMIMVLKYYKLPLFIKGVNILLVVFTFYGFIYLLTGPDYVVREFKIWRVPRIDYLKNIYCSLLPIYAYFDYAQKGVFTEKSLLKYATVLIVLTIYDFVMYMVMAKGIDGRSYEAVFQNNVGYRFIPILAMLLLVKRWKFFLGGICFIFIMMSLKRGAMVIGSVVTVVLFLQAIKTVSRKKKMWAAMFCMILAIGLGIWLINFYESTPLFQQRMEMTAKGDASGRNDIYAKLFDYAVNQDSDLAFLIGNGADATVGIAKNYAHNDWLEIMINQGVIGVLIYIAFFVMWFINYRKMKKTCHDSSCVTCFGTLLFVFLALSLFSMAYTSFGPVYAICIGTVFYRCKNFIRANRRPLSFNPKTAVY